MQNFDIDDMLFGGSPLSRLVDILSVANKNLIELELERLMTKTAAMEDMLEQRGVSEREINAYAIENADALRDDVLSMALALAGDIVTQNE